MDYISSRLLVSKDVEVGSGAALVGGSLLAALAMPRWRGARHTREGQTEAIDTHTWAPGLIVGFGFIGIPQEI